MCVANKRQIHADFGLQINIPPSPPIVCLEVDSHIYIENKNKIAGKKCAPFIFYSLYFLHIKRKNWRLWVAMEGKKLAKIEAEKQFPVTSSLTYTLFARSVVLYTMHLICTYRAQQKTGEKKYRRIKPNRQHIWPSPHHHTQNPRLGDEWRKKLVCSSLCKCIHFEAKNHSVGFNSNVQLEIYPNKNNWNCC